MWSYLGREGGREQINVLLYYMSISYRSVTVYNDKWSGSTVDMGHQKMDKYLNLEKECENNGAMPLGTRRYLQRVSEHCKPFLCWVTQRCVSLMFLIPHLYLHNYAMVWKLHTLFLPTSWMSFTWSLSLYVQLYQFFLATPTCIIHCVLKLIVNYETINWVAILCLVWIVWVFLH